MKSSPLLFILPIFFAGKTFAQTPQENYRKHMIDSIKKVYLREAAIRNPALRQVTVSTDLISRGEIHSKLYGNELYDGKISQVRTTALLTVPVVKWKKNAISTSFSFFNQYFDVNNVTFPLYDSIKVNHGYRNKLTVGFTASYQRVDSLLGQMVVYTGNLSLLTGDASSIQKVSFLGGVIFILKQTPVTNISVGLFANIDPSINVPVVPFFIYWHKFKNEVELSVNLPQQVMLRKALSKNAWFNLGSSLTGAVAFFQSEQPGIPRNINYSSLDVKSGAGLEFRLSKIVLLGINGGVMTPIMSRQFELNKRSDDYFISNKINTTPYGNVTISLLPFL